MLIDEVAQATETSCTWPGRKRRPKERGERTEKNLITSRLGVTVGTLIHIPFCIMTRYGVFGGVWDQISEPNHGRCLSIYIYIYCRCMRVILSARATSPELARQVGQTSLRFYKHLPSAFQNMVRSIGTGPPVVSGTRSISA